MTTHRATFKPRWSRWHTGTIFNVAIIIAGITLWLVTR